MNDQSFVFEIKPGGNYVMFATRDANIDEQKVKNAFSQGGASSINIIFTDTAVVVKDQQ